MANASFKQALGKFFKDNPEDAAKKFKSLGFSEDEAARFQRGDFAGFSDQQLSERFNPKVLGTFGIDTNSFFFKDGQFFFKEGQSSFKKKNF